MIAIVGWDVGGANVKATGLAGETPAGLRERTASLPFEIWRAKERLPEILALALGQVAGEPPQAMALTMTAELSDVFGSKREGVLFVLDSVIAAFPRVPTFVLSLAGSFESLAAARQHPLDFAAANWLALALWLARHYPQCLLVDVGSTTTDLIPILDGQVAAAGRTDLDRLLTGELVYTGALRTNAATIAQTVPVRGGFCPAASEYFAISGDAHLVLGYLAEEDYTCPTPDGREATRTAAGARLARLVCADTETLSKAEIAGIARHIYEQQVEQIERGMSQVLSRIGWPRDLPVVTAGLGAFLAQAAAGRLGLPSIDLARKLGSGPNRGHDASLVAPSWAAAHLLLEHLTAQDAR